MNSKDVKKYFYLFVVPLLFLVVMWFFSNEWIIFFATLILISISFWIKYEKNEIYFFLVGVLLGIIGEVGGDYFNQLQYWENGSFFGVPIWLPVLWGYACVYFRRLGNFIINKKF